jgi:hypothetical protein
MQEEQEAMILGRTLMGSTSAYHSEWQTAVPLSEWKTRFDTRIDLGTLTMDYVRFVANFFKNDPDGKLVDVSFDLFKELNAETISRKTTAVFDFVSETYKALTSVLPSAIVTMAMAKVHDGDLFLYYRLADPCGLALQSARRRSRSRARARARAITGGNGGTHSRLHHRAPIRPVPPLLVVRPSGLAPGSSTTARLWNDSRTSVQCSAR